MSAQNALRHNARIIVLQRLFELDFKSNNLNLANPELFSEELLQEASELTEYDQELAKTLFDGVQDHMDKLDTLVKQLAPEWPLSNIARIDLMILRLAITEGFILNLTPQKVVIDEAIELAKEFSNDQTRKFVSGVLGNLFIKQQEIL